MGIVQNIPRKQGTLVFRPPNPNQTGIFGFKGTPVRDVAPPFAIYASPLTSSNAHPLGALQNTATIVMQVPVVPTGDDLADLVNPADKRLVMPHEKGKFFSRVAVKRVAVRTQGGVNNKSDTAFHPTKRTVTIRPQRFPAKAGERHQEESFGSSVHLTGNVNVDPEGSRWGKVKTSAAEGYAGSIPTGAAPHDNDNKVASGSSGRISTCRGGCS